MGSLSRNSSDPTSDGPHPSTHTRLKEAVTSSLPQAIEATITLMPRGWILPWGDANTGSFRFSRSERILARLLRAFGSIAVGPLSACYPPERRTKISTLLSSSTSCEMRTMTGFELLLEYLTRYFPILLFIFIALAFGVVTLVLSYFVQPRYPEPEKLSTYECGSEPFSDARMPFPVRYYVFAMLFVIFDIEVIFLYPWAIVFEKLGIIGLVEMMVFIALFLVAYVYAWRKGALEWD